MSKHEIERMIRRCLPTLNNVSHSWSGDYTIYMSYALGKPSSKDRVELRFAKPGNQTRWALYACSENFLNSHWELVQSKLQDAQKQEK